MLKLLLWVAIGVLLFFLVKRVSGGLVVGLVFIGAVFFSIFMLDTFTTVNVRNYIQIAFYDKTVDDPKGTVEGLKDKLQEGVDAGKGKEVVDKINEIGDTVDKKYGTEIEKKAKGEAEKKEAEEETKEDKPKSSQDVQEPGKLGKGERYVKYTEVTDFLNKHGDAFTEKEVAMIKTIVPMLVMEYTGDTYTIWNEKGEDGLHIRVVEHKGKGEK